MDNIPYEHPDPAFFKEKRPTKEKYIDRVEREAEERTAWHQSEEILQEELKRRKLT